MQATKVLSLKRETGHNTSSITNESTYADEQVIKKLGSRQWPIWSVDNNIGHVRNLMKTSCDPLSCGP
jgi:glutaredoxin